MSVDRPSDAPCRVLVITPPFVRALQPHLGPALLVAAAAAEGAESSAVDLNLAWIRDQLSDIRPTREQQAFVGRAQHPADTFDPHLEILRKQHLRAFAVPAAWSVDDRTLDLTYPFADVVRAAERHTTQQHRWILKHLRRACPRPHAPLLCWLHVDSELQVLWALAVGVVLRELWPEAGLIWSGALVADLIDEITTDPRYGSLIDGFVPHRPHAVIAGVIRELVADGPMPPTLVRAGQRREQTRLSDAIVVPRFPAKLIVSGGRVALPIRLNSSPRSRCPWCPTPRRLVLRIGELQAVIRDAHDRGADLEFLDRGMDAASLDAVCRVVAGDVGWSMRCDFVDDHATALAERFTRVVAAGCRTLHLSLHPHALREPARRGRLPDVLRAILRAARRSAIPLVIRRVNGYPGTRTLVHPLVDSKVHGLLARALDGYPAPLQLRSVEYRPRRTCFRPSGCTTDRWDLLRAAPWSGVLQWRVRASSPHDDDE